jgi:hypothetical protein
MRGINLSSATSNAGFSFTHLRTEGFMQNLLGYGGES